MRQDTMSSGSGVKYTLPANLDLKYHTKKVFHLLSLNKQNFFFRTCLQPRWISQTVRSVRHMIDTFFAWHYAWLWAVGEISFVSFFRQPEKDKVCLDGDIIHAEAFKGPSGESLVCISGLVSTWSGLQLCHHFYGVENNKLWRFTVQNLEWYKSTHRS